MHYDALVPSKNGAGVKFTLVSDSQLLKHGTEVRAILLFYAEGVGLFHCEKQLLMQDLQRRVGWQVEAVEAGVRARQAVGLAPLLDAELTRANGAAQCRKALIRDARRASHKLHEAQTLLVAEPGNTFFNVSIRLNTELNV